jgi:hypothetical protein
MIVQLHLVIIVKIIFFENSKLLRIHDYFFQDKKTMGILFE